MKLQNSSHCSTEILAYPFLLLVLVSKTRLCVISLTKCCSYIVLSSLVPLTLME